MQAEARSAASVHEVWEVLADVTGWPTWSPTMTSVEPLEAGRAIGDGARYRIRQPKLPKAVWTVTDWQPGRSFTWVATSPGVTTTATHELTRATDGGTAIRLGLEWSGPLAGLLRRLYGRLARRYIDTEARELAARAA